jgi:acyl dehydratase
MPLSSSVVGLSTEPSVHDIDARWTMAYAAGIDDLSPFYIDTTSHEPVVAHPLFPVCVEWPSVLEWRRRSPDHGITRDEAVRGVHADHRLTIHRLIRAGDRLSTTATIERVERRAPGAYQVLRLDTVDHRGDPVATTLMGLLFLGVEVDGEDRALGPPATADASTPSLEDGVGPVCDSGFTARRTIPANAAHVYTECSRIWNPIHTDRAVAASAGLPAPILHGTATLAIAVSEIVARAAGSDPHRIREISGRFAAMVAMPSEITIDVAHHEHGVSFVVTNQEGEQAVRNGLVVIGP